MKNQILFFLSLGLGLTACGPGLKTVPLPHVSVSTHEVQKQATSPTEEVPEIPANTELPEEVKPVPPPNNTQHEIPPEFDNEPAPPVTGNPSTKPGPVPPTILPSGVINVPDSRHIVETGQLIPSIYYSPIYDEDTMLCQESVRREMKDMSGNKIMDVCPKTHASCGYQGSCVIKKNNVQKVYNVINRIDGEDRFAVVSDRCKFGYGVHDSKKRRSFCLEPYVTIAADQSIYKPGDVIYIPKARGLELPSGRKHDGYFIVADAGRLIKGKGRFDFFSGNQHWMNAQNPLSKIKLNDKDSNLEYHRVEGEVAEHFRNKVKDLIAY